MKTWSRGRTVVVASLLSASVAGAQPLLPLPLEQLPRELRTVRVESTFARRTLFQAICGAQNDLHEQWLNNHLPGERVRTIARALSAPTETARVLACHRELERALTKLPVVRTISFELPASSSETVAFFELPLEALPATAAYGKDGELIAGEHRGRCFTSFERPARPCEALSEAIMYWPERRLWLAGRVVGLEHVLKAAQTPSPHQAGPQVAQLLEAAKSIELRTLSLPSRSVEGAQDGASVTRFVEAEVPDAEKLEAQLRAELDAAQKREAARTAWNCPDCAPLLRGAYVKLLALELVQRRKEVAATTISREGSIVTMRRPKLEDAALERANRAYEEARARRAAKIKPLLDAWIAGKPPSPAQLGAIDGAAFGRAVQENLR